MCGRYVLDVPGTSLIDTFEIIEDAELFQDLKPRKEIFPSQTIPAVRYHDGKRAACMLRWGLVPHWAKDLKFGYKTINARSETVAEKPSFRSAFKSRRCLIPATGWFEWTDITGKKERHHLSLKSTKLIAFAGLWETWTDKETGEIIESGTIIVTSAAPSIETVHDRMPVILRPSDYDLWLNTDVSGTAQLLPLLRPYPGNDLDSHAVSEP